LQLECQFIETHDRAGRIIWFSIQVEHIFHAPDKGGTDGGNAPLLF
jgi:hypothetical protein